MAKRYRGNQRCSICNKVSTAELLDDIGETYHGSYHLDQNGIDLTCSECMSEINDIRAMYQLEDETNG